MSLSSSSETCISSLNKILTFLDKENNEFVPKALTQKLEKLAETYDMSIEEDTRDMRNLKDYLQMTNDKMRIDVIEFIKSRGQVGGIDLKNIL
jgi:hypothetical protein